MTLKRRAWLSAALALGTGAGWAQPAGGKPIRLIVPYPPGGGTDILARQIARGMSERLGVQLVIENKGGANGLLAAEQVARAEPDGNTLLVMDNALVVNPYLFKDFTLNPEKDFSAISLMGTAPLVLVVNPAVPADSVKELVAYAKAHPGKLSYGSAGNGNPTHIAPEMFKLATGTDILQVPYKGSGPAITDLVSGQVSMMFTGISAVKGFVGAGRLRPLAVTGKIRSTTLPNVPTLTQAGTPIAELEQGSWWGIVGPAGLPAAAATRLAQAVQSAAQDADIRARLASMSITSVSNTPDEFARWIGAESVKYATLLKRANIEAN